MDITRETLDAYNTRLDALAGKAEQAALEAYDRMRATDLSTGTADIRDGIETILETINGSYGEAAGSLAADMYDALAEQAGRDDLPEAEVSETTDEDATAIDRRVRWLVGQLTNREREDI